MTNKISFRYHDWNETNERIQRRRTCKWSWFRLCVIHILRCVSLFFQSLWSDSGNAIDRMNYVGVIGSFSAYSLTLSVCLYLYLLRYVYRAWVRIWCMDMNKKTKQQHQHRISQLLPICFSYFFSLHCGLCNGSGDIFTHRTTEAIKYALSTVFFSLFIFLCLLFCTIDTQKKTLH